MAFAAYVAAGSVKLVPVPAFQVLPPSVEYSHVAPASSPPTVTVPFLVMPSVALAPVSVMLSAPMAGAAVSTVKARADVAGDEFALVFEFGQRLVGRHQHGGLAS